MQTITSPSGTTHLVHSGAATYRGVHRPTTTWCGIRATRTWRRSEEAGTCPSCRRRQDAGDPVAHGAPGAA